MFLLGVVIFAHHPAIFMGLLLFFIGYSAAYPRHHDPLILREALLVAFFLAGLVVLGGLQQWWLQPLLTSMSPSAVLRRHRADGDHRQRRADLPRLAGRGHLDEAFK